ncbi:MAG: phosphoenolpyruvate synthase [Candidatus Parvarchaeota archaeon]|nr:phosphoenolpyruvate synthase [Candidatus Rehaiarchaeum fermentans]
MDKSKALVLWFKEISKDDELIVGGKSANLGEMYNSVKVPIPNGFSTTSLAYKKFIEENGLEDKIENILKNLDENDSKQLEEASKKIRNLIVNAKLSKEFEKEILDHYHELIKEEGQPFVAVRSSGTAEDLPNASFAGQQETYLNVKGDKELLQKIKQCFASLYTERAIYYRRKMKIDENKIALAVAVQKQVYSKSAGVMFTLNVSNGDTSVIMIESSYGLGEYVVQGTLTPDIFYVDKATLSIKERSISNDKTKMLVVNSEGGTEEEKVPKELVSISSLTDEQVLTLAKYGLEIERHYNHPMDIEWALDERDNNLYIVQARFETYWSERKASSETKEVKGEEKDILVKGLPASPGVASGRAHVLLSVNEINEFKEGEILITKMTAPDWVPAMQKAAAIITDEGGMTSHAAIVSRELGVPAIVGTSAYGKKATETIKTGEFVTVDAKNGVVYRGTIVQPQKEESIVQYSSSKIVTGTKILVNLSEPAAAERVAKLNVDGVGLMREEFIWAQIGEHPLKLIEEGRGDELIDKLSSSLIKVCQAFKPKPVILRFSDFKTDEYANLKGGEKYEPKEDNPLLGWRGSSRYYDEKYVPAFRLELRAVRKVREDFGFKNLWVMIPFTRTVDELEKVIEIMKSEGLERNKDFKVFLMAEIPSNILLADKFNKYIDGYSIGSNDLTMLVLGADRNNALMSSRYDERDLAVKRAIKLLIDIAHRDGKIVSICGQAPSEYDDIVEFLVRVGIDEISVNPDAVDHVRELVAQVESRVILDAALGREVKNNDWDIKV